MSVAANHQPAAPPSASEFQHLPLGLITPSSTNPRKSFDGPEFDELVASVQQHGILQPVLVRPFVDCESFNGITGEGAYVTTYELVCGERRFRAACRAGLAEIPATVRELSDTEAREIQIIENLQRKDVSALEEAEGFRQLLAALQVEQPAAGQKELVQTIAQKVGKSIRYVYARMALDKLIPEFKDAIAKGVLTPSHGDLLAMFSENRQREIYVDEFCEAYDEATERYQEMRDAEAAGEPVAEEERVALSDLKLYEPSRVPSVRMLKDRLVATGEDLKKAAWKWNKENGEATPDNPHCLGCEFNTACMEGGDEKHPKCTNSDCFARKMKYFVQIELDYLRQTTGKDEVRVANDYPHKKGVFDNGYWKKAALGSCDHVVPALVVNYEGEWLGALSVCVDRKCKVHFGETKKPESAADKKQREEEAKKKAEVARENKIRAKLFEAVVAKTTAVTPELLRTFILAVIDEWRFRNIAKLAPTALEHVKKAKTDSVEFAQALVAYLCAYHVEASEWSGPQSGKKEFHENLKAFGLDWQTLRAKFAAEVDGKVAPKADAPKAKTSAELAALPIAPGSLSSKKLPKKAAKTTTKKAAKPAKKSAKKGGRK